VRYVQCKLRPTVFPQAETSNSVLIFPKKRGYRRASSCLKSSAISIAGVCYPCARFASRSCKAPSARQTHRLQKINRELLRLFADIALAHHRLCPNIKRNKRTRRAGHSPVAVVVQYITKWPGSRRDSPTTPKNDSPRSGLGTRKSVRHESHVPHLLGSLEYGTK